MSSIVLTANVSDYPSLCRAVCALLNRPDGGRLDVALKDASNRAERDRARNIVDAVLCDGVYPPADPRDVREVEEDKTGGPSPLLSIVLRPTGQTTVLRVSACDGVFHTTTGALPDGFPAWYEARHPRHPHALPVLSQLLLPHKAVTAMTLTLCVVATVVEWGTDLVRYLLAARCKKRRAYVCVGFLRGGGERSVLRDAVPADAHPVDEASLHVYARKGAPVVLPQLLAVAVGCDVVGLVRDGALQLFEVRVLHGYVPDATPPSLQSIIRGVEAATTAATEEALTLPPEAGDVVRGMQALGKTHFGAAPSAASDVRAHMVPGPWGRGRQLPMEEGGTREYKAPEKGDGMSDAKNVGHKVATWSCQYLTSFLNTRGGVLVYGVNDRGTVVGVRAPDLQGVTTAFHGGVARIHPAVPRNCSAVESSRVVSADTPGTATKQWWETSVGAVATTTVTASIVVQCAVAAGRAPFYTAGAASTSPAWGRYLASTQPMHSAVLLDRLSGHLASLSSSGSPPIPSSSRCDLAAELALWQTIT